MKTAEQIVESLLERIRNMSERPLMYARTAQELDGLLWHFTRLWAEIIERDRDFFDALAAVSAEVGCGSDDFSNFFASTNPVAPDSAVRVFVLEQWAKITARLDIPFKREASVTKPSQ
jgi:hypothetical protein